MKARILIVDDEEAIAWALCQAMTEDGHEAVFANSGRAALERAREGDFDLIFTDLKMPGMSGTDMVRKLREKGSKAKVVIMTAYGSLETAIQALRLGAVEYLIKPVHLAQAKQVAAAALATSPTERYGTATDEGKSDHTETRKPNPGGRTEGVPAAQRVEEEQLALPCNPSALVHVREAAEQFAERTHLSYDDKHTLMTAATEAAINAICHAYHRETEGKLNVRYARDNHQVRIEVWDEGQGFNPAAYRPPGTMEYDDIMRPMGRGIFLMRSIMHEFDVISNPDGGTRVRMSMNLDGATRFAA